MMILQVITARSGWARAPARELRSLTQSKPGPSRPRDRGDDAIEIREHVILAEANDAPPELLEGPIAGGIWASTLLVVCAVDFDDEACLGASEVDDVGPDNELTTEGKTGLG